MKPLAPEGNFIGIGVTANQISGATVVRLVNTSENSGTVQVLENDAEYNYWGPVIGSITIPAGEVVYIQKKSEEWLSGDSYIKYAKVAYSHMMSFASYGSSGGGGGSGIVTQNLVLNLDAGDSSSYSGSGTAWNDISGQGNHATLINGPSYFTNHEGYLRFDGNNDYATLPAIDLTGNEITFAIWTKTLSQSNVSSLIFLGDSSGASGGRILNVHSLPFSNSYYYFDKGYWDSNGVYQGYDRLDGNFMMNSDWNGWRHWVFTANASTGSMKMYRDGILYHTELPATFSRPLSNANGDIRRIARSNLTHTYYGEISNLQIYKKELSASEVTQNFDAVKSRFGL